MGIPILCSIGLSAFIVWWCFSRVKRRTEKFIQGIRKITSLPTLKVSDVLLIRADGDDASAGMLSAKAINSLLTRVVAVIVWFFHSIMDYISNERL